MLKANPWTCTDPETRGHATVIDVEGPRYSCDTDPPNTDTSYPVAFFDPLHEIVKWESRLHTSSRSTLLKVIGSGMPVGASSEGDGRLLVVCSVGSGSSISGAGAGGRPGRSCCVGRSLGAGGFVDDRGDRGVDDARAELELDGRGVGVELEVGLGVGVAVGVVEGVVSTKGGVDDACAGTGGLVRRGS